jgi:hypothetical protein
MRQAIKEQLINHVPEIGGRCFEPQQADNASVKPFLVVRQGAEAEDKPWCGFRRIIEVWPHVDQSQGFAALDGLAVKINLALEQQLLITEAETAFSCVSWGAVGTDTIDPICNTLTRCLQFAVLALQPVELAETAPIDPWLAALADWTREKLGTDWSVYCNLWPAGYRRPALMWRMTNVEAYEKGRGMFEIRKKFVGHVLGSSVSEQINGAMQVVEQLTSDIKLVLDADDKRYLTVEEPTVNYQANPVNKGQIAVFLSRMTKRPTEEAPLMMAIHDTGTVK